MWNAKEIIVEMNQLFSDQKALKVYISESVFPRVYNWNVRIYMYTYMLLANLCIPICRPFPIVHSAKN